MEGDEGGESPNTRLLAFSDGVIAVAITLLILEIRLPEEFGAFTDTQLWASLLELWPRFMAFLISFAVIGVYWLNHHRKFDLIVKSDSGLKWLNLLFLLTICVIPFVTAVIAQNSGFVGTAIYATVMMSCGLSLALLWFYADRKQMLDPECSLDERRRVLIGTLVVPAIFAISVPLSLAHPDGAKFFWLLIIPANFGLRLVMVLIWKLRHPGQPFPARRDDHTHRAE
ncbi:MAG TPA: TMEM175 family protein [Devosia sp.]|nr:TMEM175 family protein [Devosia sp.]